MNFQPHVNNGGSGGSRFRLEFRCMFDTILPINRLAAHRGRNIRM